jgi:hypothetical protein
VYPVSDQAGCILYRTRRVYEARTSQSVGQRLSQTNLLSMFGSSRERVEYVHVKGTGDKGHVELAISKPKVLLVVVLCQLCS